MPKSKFLKLFTVIEVTTAIIFLSLALIFFLNINLLEGNLLIPYIFAFIGLCSAVAAPILFSYAKKAESKEKNINIE